MHQQRDVWRSYRVTWVTFWRVVSIFISRQHKMNPTCFCEWTKKSRIMICIFFVDHTSATNLVLHREMASFSAQWHEVRWRLFGSGSGILSLCERFANEGESTINWRFRTCQHSSRWTPSSTTECHLFPNLCYSTPLLSKYFSSPCTSLIFNTFSYYHFLRRKKPLLAIC
jgi:hypothetical protein